jgi:hypothetical protein
MEDSMKTLLLLFALMTSANAKTFEHDYRSHMPPRYVDDDNGGIIGTYLLRVYKSEHIGQHVIIRGMCASACTYELNSPLHCVMPGAVLYFHTSPLFPEADKDMLALYKNGKLVDYINSRGGLTEDGWSVKGEELITQGAANSCDGVPK